jgi:hypothetical protein
MAATNPPLVWINGWPGVGKLTVAEWLFRLLGPEKAVLFDKEHQKREDEISCESPPRPATPEYHQMRKEHRQSGLATCMASPAMLSRIVIFIDCQTDEEPGPSIAWEYEQAAKSCGRLFLPVYLECQIDENVKRVESLERQSSTRSKIKCGNLAKSLRRNRKLYMFKDYKGLQLNVTDLEAHEAAMEVLSFVTTMMDRAMITVRTGTPSPLPIATPIPRTTLSLVDGFFSIPTRTNTF